MAAPSVFLVDDDVAVCDAIKWLLDSIGLGLRVFNNTRDFLDFYTPELSGCLVLDVRMPEMSGMVLLERLMAAKTRLAVIMLTGHGDISMAVSAIKLGAVDFLTKPFNHQSLIDKIQNTLEKIDIAADSSLQKEIRECYASLTEREHRVLSLITAGNLNKQIAAILCVSVSTVESIRARLMYKMQAKTAADLVRKSVIADHCETP